MILPINILDCSARNFTEKTISKLLSMASVQKAHLLMSTFAPFCFPLAVQSQQWLDQFTKETFFKKEILPKSLKASHRCGVSSAFKRFQELSREKKSRGERKKMSREIGTYLYHHQSSLVKCQPLMSKGQPHKRPQQCSLHTRPKVNNASAFSEQYSSSSTINTPTRTYGGLYRRTSTKKGEIQFRNKKYLKI